MQLSNHTLHTLIQKNKEFTIVNINALVKVMHKQEIYIQSILEYDRKFWWLPKGIYPGSYFFKKIIKKKLNIVINGNRQNKVVKSPDKSNSKEPLGNSSGVKMKVMN